MKLDYLLLSSIVIIFIRINYQQLTNSTSNLGHSPTPPLLFLTTHIHVELVSSEWLIFFVLQVAAYFECEFISHYWR